MDVHGYNRYWDACKRALKKGRPVTDVKDDGKFSETTLKVTPLFEPKPEDYSFTASPPPPESNESMKEVILLCALGLFLLFAISAIF